MLYLGGVYANGTPHFATATMPSFPVSADEPGSGGCETYLAFRDLAGIRYGDFNADGKTDILQINKGAPSIIYLSTGDVNAPFKAENGPDFGLVYQSNYSKAMIDLQRIKLGDFNGDGKTDFLKVNGWGTTKPLTIYLTESGDSQLVYSTIQSVDANNGPISFFVNAGDYDSQCEDDSYKAIVSVNRFMLGDFTGNGKTGFYYMTDDHILTLYEASPDITDLVQKINTSSGAKITLDYGRSTWYPNSQIPFSMPVLSSTKIDLGNTDTTPNEIIETIYTYGDGYYDVPDKELRGFGYVGQFNPDKTTLETWFLQDADFKGRPYHTELREPWQGVTPGTLLSTTDLTWGKTVNGESVFVKLKDKTITSTIGSTTVTTTEQYTYDPDNGNILTVTVGGPGAESIKTTNTYQDYGTYPIQIYRNTVTTVKSVGATTLVRNTTSDYETGTGNMLWKQLWLEGGGSPKYSYTYTAEGNLATETDPKGNVTGANPDAHKTTYAYDTKTATFVTEVHYPTTTNSGGVTVEHVTKKEYDYRFGLPSASWDENNNRTDYLYDDFGRPESVIAYEGEGPTMAAKTLKYYFDADDANTPYIKTRVLGNIVNGAEVFIDSYEYFDYLGRTIQTITYGIKDGAKTPIVTRTYYNRMGRVYKTEGPYFSAGTGYPKAAPAQAPHAETEYNSFGKPITISARVGDSSAQSGWSNATSNIIYDGLSTTVTDPDLKKKTELKDYLGRVIQVTEYRDDGTSFVTGYDYNAAGDLLFTTDQAGHVTELDYDTLGRKVYMKDPDMREWKYCYDINSNLKKQMDAKGQIISFTYDVLNRVLIKNFSKVDDPTVIAVEDLCSTAGTPMASVTYTYDNTTAQNGLGRLSSLTNANATSAYKYDSLGREVNTRKTINAVVYETSKDYDYAGRPKTVTYPDLFVATYTYWSGTGLLKKVSGEEPGVPAGGTSKDYATFNDYEATDKMEQVDFGNNTHTLYSYDPWSTRLTDILTTSPTSNGVPKNDVINREYRYTMAGDISKIIDYQKGSDLALPNDVLAYTYTYDSLHRLKTETITANTYSRVIYTYNEIGNIMSKTLGSNTYIYEYNTGPAAIRPHAVKRITANGTPYDFTYDNNGNMKTGYDLTNLTNIGTRTITYNADNKPVEIAYTKGSTTNVSFRYDGQGNRVIKSSNQGTTYYVGEHYEVVNDAGVKYIFAGNLRIAKIDSSKTSSDRTLYYHKDHLGSSSAITNENGAVVEKFTYRPFGDQRAHSGDLTTDYKFTDQEFDAETGLYYYGARYYDPTIGRFISPDSVVPNPFNPQNLNRYTYCNNNPLSYTDPNGHFPLILIGMAVGAIMGAVSAGIQSHWDLGAMVQGAFMGAASAVTMYAFGPIIGGAMVGAVQAGISGGDPGKGALWGAIGGTIGAAMGGVDFSGIGNDLAQITVQMVAAGVVGGVLAEFSGAKFSQGMLPAMASVAMNGLAKAINNQNSNKGVTTGREEALLKMAKDLTLDQILNGSNQTVRPYEVASWDPFGGLSATEAENRENYMQAQRESQIQEVYAGKNWFLDKIGRLLVEPFAPGGFFIDLKHPDPLHPFEPCNNCH